MAQKRKGQNGRPYFATWNSLSPQRDFQRLNAGRGNGNLLGFSAPDALASPEHSPNQINNERLQKSLPQGVNSADEITDLRDAGN
jgi:hypothetical protein